jgi:hypothetical protein
VKKLWQVEGSEAVNRLNYRETTLEINPIAPSKGDVVGGNFLDYLTSVPYFKGGMENVVLLPLSLFLARVVF